MFQIRHQTLRRSSIRKLLIIAVLGVTLLDGSAAQAAYPRPQGAYVLTSTYSAGAASTRGWQIEWRVPALNNPGQAWGAIGQWYYNLESGIYRTPDGWFVYYFGDGNGTAGNNPDCNTMWGSGGTCGGPLSGFGAGKEINFRYVWCDAARNPSLTGSRVCLHVDMEDGAGWRFLAEDTRVNPEIYAHDIETFDQTVYPRPLIPCATIPTKMIQQRVKGSDGVWRNVGGYAWTYQDTTTQYKFQNITRNVTPSHWESCSEGTGT